MHAAVMAAVVQQAFLKTMLSATWEIIVMHVTTATIIAVITAAETI